MEVAIEAGADDIVNNDDHFEVSCEITEFDNVSTALHEKGIQPDSSELVYLPHTLTPVTDPDTVKQVLRLTETLEDLEDVKAVHANYDIDEALLGG